MARAGERVNKKMNSRSQYEMTKRYKKSESKHKF